jgi:mannose-6-phosphate isomerase-like protein (cupin superfamily)
MQTLRITIGLMLGAAIAFAQQGAPGATSIIKLYSSAADVQALIEKAKSERKDDAPLVAERILQLQPYNANLEYRAAVGPAAVHEKEAEMFYVIDGSATMITGGRLREEKRTNAENLSGTGIDGGATRNVAKGDFIIVPEGVAHWFSQINGTLVLMSLHVPRPLK